MSTLELRCRLLLFAYPAGYRRERAEEMVGTLLETTPEGRVWPLPRDVWALVLGGLRARSANSRRLGIAANLRLAALFGVAIYLSVVANSDLYWGLTRPDFRVVIELGPPLPLLPWPFLVQGLLIALTVLAAWFARRTAVIIAAVAAGAEYYAVAHLFPGRMIAVASGQLPLLVALAALVLLAGGRDRPPRVWLCLPGLAVVAPVVSLLIPIVRDWFPYVYGVTGGQTTLMTIMVVVFAAMLCIDPRPALALAIYFALFLASQLDLALQVRMPPGTAFSLSWLAWDWLWAALVIATLALLRTRRRAVI